MARKCLRKILLAAPELAAALSYESFAEPVECLIGRLREELRAMSDSDVFDSVIGYFVAEVAMDDPEGEVRPSAAVAFQAYVVIASRAAGLTIDDAVSREVDDSGEAKFTEGMQAEAPPLPGGKQSSAAEETSNVPGAENVGQPSANRVRTELQGKTYEFDFENPEIPCPGCSTVVSLSLTRCPQCGTSFLKGSANSTAEFQKTQGLHQKIQFANRDPRSEMGSIKQVLRGHRKFTKEINPYTGLLRQSIEERFDVVCRSRWLQHGRTREMLPRLHDFVTKPLLGERQSYRSHHKIKKASASHVANAGLDDSGSARCKAEHPTNPD